MKRFSILLLTLVFVINANAQQKPFRPYRYFLELGLNSGTCGMFSYSRYNNEPIFYFSNDMYFPTPTGLNVGFVVASGHYQARLGILGDSGDNSRGFSWAEYSLSVGKLYFPKRFISFDVNAGLAYQTLGYEIYHSPSIPGFRGYKEDKTINQLGIMLDANCKILTPLIGISIGYYFGLNPIGYNTGISCRLILGKAGHTPEEWKRYNSVAVNQEK